LLLDLVLGTLLQSLGQFLQRFIGVRAGLSTRQGSCKHLVSVGAGLPTQWVSGCLLVLQGGYEYLSGVGGDLSFELPEFECRHRFEVGLHRRHLRADFLLKLSSFVWCH